MSAEIFIESKQHGASRYWIENQVIRLGGSAECEVQLPGLDDNAITVQFRDGDYLVWNRMQTPIKLGRRVIAANAVGKWAAKKVLFIGPYQLTLQIKGDPQPIPQSLAAKKAAVIEGGLENSNKPSTDSNLVNISALIAIAVILMFLLNSNGKAGATPLEPIVQALIEGSNKGDMLAGKIRNSLQQGRDAETRQNTKAAIEHYLTARDQTRQSQLDDTMKLQLVNYLNQRLQRLNF